MRVPSRAGIPLREKEGETAKETTQKDVIDIQCKHTIKQIKTRIKDIEVQKQ